MYAYILWVGMCDECGCLQSRETASNTLELELQMLMSCLVWDPNSDPLEGQQALLTVGPLFGSQMRLFMNLVSWGKNESPSTVDMFNVCKEWVVFWWAFITVIYITIISLHITRQCCWEGGKQLAVGRKEAQFIFRLSQRQRPSQAYRDEWTLWTITEKCGNGAHRGVRDQGRPSAADTVLSAFLICMLSESALAKCSRKPSTKYSLGVQGCHSFPLAILTNQKLESREILNIVPELSIQPGDWASVSLTAGDQQPCFWGVCTMLEHFSLVLLLASAWTTRLPVQGAVLAQGRCLTRLLNGG